MYISHQTQQSLYDARVRDLIDHAQPHEHTRMERIERWFSGLRRLAQPMRVHEQAARCTAVQPPGKQAY